MEKTATSDVNRDDALIEAIERRKAGIEFLTAEQSLANMRAAIRTGKEHDELRAMEK
jgi:saccharopine dehydrogenase-like NADP-dependent oxidoreductase